MILNLSTPAGLPGAVGPPGKGRILNVHQVVPLSFEAKQDADGSSSGIHPSLLNPGF
jgi:hypothetical protein